MAFCGTTKGWGESIQIHILQSFLTVPVHHMHPAADNGTTFQFLLYFPLSPLCPRIFCSLFVALNFIRPTQFHPCCTACFAPSLQSCVIRLAIDSFVCIPQKIKHFLFVIFFFASESLSCVLCVHLHTLWYMQTAAVVLARNINYLCETAVLNAFGSWSSLSLWCRI